ncbi:MAG: hypothetical protein JKX92_10170 [Porticoccaceae bacterium]|nr:hypothetical protein [Porticoccaceae bacterium]
MITKKIVRDLLLYLTMLTACSVVAEPEALELNIAIDDIEAVHIEGSKVWIKLAEGPTMKLRTITTENIGNSLDLTINATPAVRNTIHSAITSGLIIVPVASDQLLNLLRPLSPARNK